LIYFLRRPIVVTARKENPLRSAASRVLATHFRNNARSLVEREEAEASIARDPPRRSKNFRRR